MTASTLRVGDRVRVLRMPDDLSWTEDAQIVGRDRWFVAKNVTVEFPDGEIWSLPATDDYVVPVWRLLPDLAAELAERELMMATFDV